MMAYDEMLNATEWEQRVIRARTENSTLRQWIALDGTPMPGRYQLARMTIPSIAVSANDPDAAIEIARRVEATMFKEDALPAA